MARDWTGVLRYAAADFPLDQAVRPAVFDAIMRALTHDRYEVDDQVALVFANNYRDIDAITKPGSPEQARIALTILRTSGALLDSLAPLNSDALAAALELRVYPITEENLRVLIPVGPISLDILRSTSADAYRYVLTRLHDYLTLVDATSDVRTVARPDEFVTVLNDIAESADASLVDRFITRSNTECRVPDLQTVASVAWPTLAAERRTDPTYTNIAAYVEHHGIDEEVSSLLTKAKQITDAHGRTLEERRQLAVELLNAADHIPSTTTRVSLAASLDPGQVPVTDLEPASGDLVARLLRKRLLPDERSTFAAGILVDWTAHEAAIAASKKYASFVAPEILSVAAMPRFFRSTKIATEAKQAVLAKASQFLAGASSQQARAVADSLIDTRWRLGYRHLDALRDAGAEPGQIIRLARARGDDLTTDELKLLLRAIGGDYQRIADGGRGRPNFPVSPSHQYVLDRLVGNTLREVEHKELKGKGSRLVAHLTSPPS